MRGDGPMVKWDEMSSEGDKTMKLEPHWPGLLRWHARGLATHSFTRGNTEPVAAFIDMVRYMTKTDEAQLFLIMHELDPSRAATMQEAQDVSNERDSSGQ